MSTNYLLDCLYCDENSIWDEENKHFDSEKDDFDAENDDLDEDYVVGLMKKEDIHLGQIGVDDDAAASKVSLMAAAGRTEAVGWMKTANGRHGFGGITLVLALNYFDRFVLKFGFQRERLPWMSQLAAVACLSLASKIEESHVPLLLDFQVESRYVFEAKTIKRMELLVLSTLQWKMNPVTPFSYFELLLRRLRVKMNTNQHWELQLKFDTLILSAITDPTFLCYLPSVMAAATMLHAMEELEHWSPLECSIPLMGFLQFSKDKVDDCYKFIKEISNDKSQKRKHTSSLSSQDSDKPSEAEGSRASLLPNSQQPPLFKRSRTLTSLQKLRACGRHCCQILNNHHSSKEAEHWKYQYGVGLNMFGNPS